MIFILEVALSRHFFLVSKYAYQACQKILWCDVLVKKLFLISWMQAQALVDDYWLNKINIFVYFAIVTARLVSCLLYGTLFLIVKCNSSDLHLKMFIFFIHLWNFGEMSIFLLASSGSYIVKNDNIHRFFFLLFWLQILNLPTSLQNKKYTDWTVSMETVCTAKSWPRKNQSDYRDLPKTWFEV